MDINTEGIQALILTFIKSLANLDLKALDFDFLGDLLTKFSAIWNPIWEIVTAWLEGKFGFRSKSIFEQVCHTADLFFCAPARANTDKHSLICPPTT